MAAICIQDAVETAGQRIKNDLAFLRRPEGEPGVQLNGILVLYPIGIRFGTLLDDDDRVGILVPDLVETLAIGHAYSTRWPQQWPPPRPSHTR